jgi:acyl-CoA thioester hydrolase
MTKITLTTDIADYPARLTVPLRYNDTDRQGHVNNAVFVTLLETGRVRLLYDADKALSPPGTQFVIANLNLDYLRELDWRHPTEIGTGIIKIGNSSVRFSQLIMQHGHVAARAETVIVLMDETTRKATKLSDKTRAELGRYALPGTLGL